MNNTVISVVLIFTTVVGIGYLIFGLRRLLTAKNERIYSLIMQKKYDTAISELKQIIDKNYKDSFAHYYLGISFFEKKNYRDALQHFDRVIQLKSFSKEISQIKTREKIAETYIKLGKLDQAQSEFFHIIGLKPNEYQYHYRVGEILYTKFNRSKALEYFKKALDLFPNHVDSLFRVGQIYYEYKKNVTLAKEYFNKAILSDEACYRAHYYLGLISKSKKAYSKAIDSLEFAAKDPNYRLLAFYQKAEVYIKVGNLEEAISQLETGIRFAQDQKDRNTLPLRYLLSECYEKLRNISGAIEQWELISLIKPDYKDVPKKLEEYQNIRMDDVLKDFLTASNDRFQTLCHRITDKFELNIVESFLEEDFGMSIVAMESQAKWRSVKKSKCLVKIYRDNSRFNSDMIRKILAEMKNIGALKGYFVTSGVFTRQAIEYAENRPIELYDVKKISELLKTT